MLSSQESLAAKFVNKGFWLYFFTFLIGPLGYLVKVLISRDLSVEEVGMLYGVISFVTFLSMYNDLGCTESLAYFLPKHIVRNEYGKAKYLIHLVFVSQMATSLAIYGILFFLAPWLSLHYFKADTTDILRIAGLFFIGINILHIATVFFIAVQDTKLQKGTELMRIGGTAIGAMILFFSASGNLERYMMIWIGGLIVGLSFAGILVMKKYYIPHFFHVKKDRDIALRNDFFKYALATLFTANIGMVLSQIDMQLIIYFLGSRDVGFYSTYLSLIAIPFMLLTPIIGFLFPVISELSGRREEYKIESLIRRFWTYFGIIGIWTSIFMFQFSDILSVFFFGEKFRESGDILAYCALFIVLNFLIQISFQVLAGTGKIRKRAEILAIVLVINIGLNLLLIPAMGTHGSALAVGLSWIPLYYLSTRATGLSLPILGERSWYINLCAAGIAYLGGDFLREYLGNIPFFFDIVLAILLYMTIFIGINTKMLREAYKTIQSARHERINTALPANPDISSPL